MNKDEWAQSVIWVGIVAGCVIERGGTYLLVQEKNPKAYGLWNLPAGYVDKDETIEQAAIREAKEESGYDVELDGRIGVYHDSAIEPVKHAYRAHIVGGELKIQEDEILDAQWLSYEQIEQLNAEGKIRAPWVYEAISASRR